VLYNGLGRHHEAAAAAREVMTKGNPPWPTIWAPFELVEAAGRIGDIEVARDALDVLTATTRPAGTLFALGIEARCRALLADGEDAEVAYREAISHLDRAGIRTELARGHLVFGEWLRGQGRLREARERLRTAEQMFAEIGMEAFADRARGELVAAGANPSTRHPEIREELTAQEEQIARLARDGFTNMQIGTQLFLSPRTVEYHLHKVFGKLGIASRSGLPAALPGEEPDVVRS
jgi:ATP/maltotriose-dependent transcriptional regulator MalT